MKRSVLLGVVLALTAMLMLSCNKNRFDFNQLESVEGSGQWKLPIGSAHTTLGAVLTQLGENSLVSYDENGNLQVAYSFQLDDIIKGASFLSLGTLDFTSEMSFENPFPSVVLPEPIDTVYRFQQIVELNADSATIESAVIKTGTMIITLYSNLGDISKLEVSSSDITMLDGDTLYVMEQGVEDQHSIAMDLAGATFRLHDEFGNADSTLVINYALHYQLLGIDDPMYQVRSVIGLENFQLQELSGYIDHFVYEFGLDTSFSLPLGNLDGQISLVGARVNIREKNTFQNFRALLQINQAEIYGPNAGASALFDHYPYVLDIIPSNTFHELIPEGECVNISMNTKYDAFRFNGAVDFNPDAAESLIVIYDTSAISLGVDAVIPMQFNIPNVAYIDTLDLDLGEISAPELVEKIVLNILFDSEMPFNLNAQFYALNSMTGQVSDALLENELAIKGSFDGQPAKSEVDVAITQDLLKKLLESDKLIMRFGVNTNNNNVYLNLNNGLGLTLKADVFYGGSLDFNDF